MNVGLLVRLEVNPGKEAEVENFLRGAIHGHVVCDSSWVLDVRYLRHLPDDSGRQAHLSGPIAAALMEKASDLFTQPPTIEHVDILASK